MSKNPRHRAGDEPVVAETSAPVFDFLAPASEPAPAPAPTASPAVAAATEATDNVAIVAGLFGAVDVPEAPRRSEPESSLGELVRPTFTPSAPVMQTWLDAPAPQVPAAAPPETPPGRRAATYSDENIFRG